MADAKCIAQNTMFMYIRMILIMAVSIFSSRVILDKLGADDYGLYNAVASVVAIITFLNQTLSTSTSRFLTFDLGQGDELRLRNTFSTTFFSHLLLVGFIVVVMESIGLWYIMNKFVIPEGREFATFMVFQLSILNTAIIVMQVPYTATIIAHENMRIYAYIGVWEVFAQLGVVYLISMSPIDKLVFYAVLLVLVRIIVFFLFWITCRWRYPETCLKPYFNRHTFRRMLFFTGWTAVANVSNSFVVQGSVLLLNLFFAPVVITAQALASQVSHAIMQFVNNFRIAMNPQIIKSYAAGNRDSSKRLTLVSVVISFDLMLIIGLPFIFTMDAVFDLWLIEVPAFSVEFTRWAVFAQILNTIGTSTYVPFVASGKLKRNALWSVVTGFSYFVLLYIFFLFGYNVMWVQYVFLLHVAFNILFVRPLLLHTEMNYQWGEIISCYWQCLKVLVVALVISFTFYHFLDKTFLQRTILFICIFITSTLSSLIFMERDLRKYALDIIQHKLLRRK